MCAAATANRNGSDGTFFSATAIAVVYEGTGT
jgi:hypothetical protein